MSKSMTAVRSAATGAPAAPRRLETGRACRNTALSGGVRPVSPSGAPTREPRCSRAQIRTVQPELPKVSGSSAVLTALMLLAVAFGVLLLGSWRAEPVSDSPEQPSAAAYVAGAEDPGRG